MVKETKREREKLNQLLTQKWLLKANHQFVVNYGSITDSKSKLFKLLQHWKQNQIQIVKISTLSVSIEIRFG